MTNSNIAKSKAEFTAKLKILRTSIDNYDRALIHILAERFRITDKVGGLKAQYNIEAFDGERQKQQTETLKLLAVQAGLEPEIAAAYLEFVTKRSVAKHKIIKENFLHSDH